MMPFERLDAWRLCHKLVLAVYRVSKAFPDDEKYGLVSQIRRAAFSAAANIAEGSARRGPREFRRFLDISLGSLAEVAYALIVARDLGYLSHEQWKELYGLQCDAGKTTWGLYRSMRNAGARRGG